MYNSITEAKIRSIPKIGDIPIDRLPQELTRIFAQIVSLRRRFVESTNNSETSIEFQSSLLTLQTLSLNLETILLAFPNHSNKEAIAFVSATAHSLTYKMGVQLNMGSGLLKLDTISPLISSIVLFLIGNSQADASEMAGQVDADESMNSSRVVVKLTNYIKALGRGKLIDILEDPFIEDEVNQTDADDAALGYLWKELGIGIYDIAERLILKKGEPANTSFDKVASLSVADELSFDQRSVLTGPHHLSKLLQILKEGILERGVINLPSPLGTDPFAWDLFLTRIARDRPYLWENHREAVARNFLKIGVSAVITLPTGAGKSTLSELKIAATLFSNKRVIYLVPTHALEDQVTRNLKVLFDQLTATEAEVDGEYTDIGDSSTPPISVMTPERCLTQLHIDKDFLSGIGLIVFDEFHLIHGTNVNRDRRSIDAMHCLLTLLTNVPNADYLLISAMVENGDEICDWLRSVTSRECVLLNSLWKPTRQLHGCLIFQEDEISKLEASIRTTKRKGETKFPPKHLKNLLEAIPFCIFSLKTIWETEEDEDYFVTNLLENKTQLAINNYWSLTTNRNKVAAELAVQFTTLGLKTLIFVNNPLIAISTSKEISSELKDRLNDYEAFLKKNNALVQSLAIELGGYEFSYLKNDGNVGVHHGTLLPIERNLIEEHFKEKDGAIALVATATLAQGINLPAEVVIIAGDDRFNEEINKVESVAPHELLNAAGRAGRAGLSSQGVVIVIPGKIVRVNGSTISNKWWELKKEVFSKTDQCLKVEDPLEHFLDTIQDTSQPLDVTQTNILFKFKSENLVAGETKKLFNNSFSAFKALRQNSLDTFAGQVDLLIKRRKELNSQAENILWPNEISYKTGLDPRVIVELGTSIDLVDFDQLISSSVVEMIDWFFTWLQEDEKRISAIFIKQSTIGQINKIVGLKFDNTDLSKVAKELIILQGILKQYVLGDSLEKISKSIPNKDDNYLTQSRNFVLRLLPEISFAFGVFSLIIVEKAQLKGIPKELIPRNIRGLASCIREGFDDMQKLFFKRNQNIPTRVDTHLRFGEQQSLGYQDN
jgi:ATP-dependent RNA helicase DOB1